MADRKIDQCPMADPVWGRQCSLPDDGHEAHVDESIIGDRLTWGPTEAVRAQETWAFEIHDRRYADDE